MFRYVAFVWNDAQPAARDAAQGLIGMMQGGAPEWQTALNQPGLAVFCAGVRRGSSEVYSLPREAGVVLGKLFTRPADGRSVSAPLTLDEREAAKILETSGRHLVDRYWGRYVAFLRNSATGAIQVLRDPTAVLPCQAVEASGVNLYFSAMDDIARLGFTAFNINWKYVAAAFCYMRLQLHVTGLEGVSQVLGGECVEWRAGRMTRSLYWNPVQVADSNVFENAAQAAQALRETARDCVHAWASCYEGIVHTLSGGLDSSIVMACLQDAPSRPRLTCVNYHSPDSDGDERSFARLSAQRAGHQLLERSRNPDVSFEPLLHMPRSSVAPVTVLYYLENAVAEAQLAAEQGATAIFSGNTGDQLFYQAFAGFGAGDYVVRHGVRPALFRIALDAARMDRASVWKVLRDALAQGFLGKRWSLRDEAGRYSKLLSPDVIEAVKRDETFIHPVLRDSGRCPSGKLFHICSLIPPPDIHTPVGRPDDPELVAPLYSQPLIEVLLRTPVYLLTQGGWDRATARRAFQHDVPREIVTRQTKGGMEEHAKAIFFRNIGLVRELLPDGFLVQEGILEREKLREVLSGNPTRLGPGTVELYDYFAAEAWVRRWCASHLLRAAA